MTDIEKIYETKAKTVRQVFGDSDSYYQIPDYQRPYSWGTEQVENLWDDVYQATVDHQETYFMGAIILTKPGNDYYEVVDGQQRLTTLTILLCVLRDHFLKTDEVIKDAIKSAVGRKYRLRLVTQSQYQNQFEKEILEGVQLSQETLSTDALERNLFLNAAMIFKTKLATLSKQEIERFSQYLLKQVVFIIITCSKQTYAIKLFQVLNTRGLDLTNTDIIKSHLFGNCDEKKRDQLKASWIQIEETARDVEDDTDRLITYFGLSVLKKNPRAALSAELINHNYFRSNDSNTIVFAMKKFCDAYRDIYNEESKVIYSLWYLPNDIYWKSIATTASARKYRHYEELLLLLRRFFWVYWIGGFNISKVKQSCFNMLSWVESRKNISSISGELERKMVQDEAIEYMKKNLNDDCYDQRWLKPLLMLIEYNRTDDAKPTWVELDRKLQVEHILPRNWVKVPDWSDCWREDDARHWVNKLGNLTLLSGKKNLAASNEPFSEKRIAYKEKHGGMTAFEITKEIAKSQAWTVKEVKKRHKMLIDEIMDLLGVS